MYIVIGEWDNVKFIPVEENTLYSWDFDSSSNIKINQLKLDIFESNLESQDAIYNLENEKY